MHAVTYIVRFPIVVSSIRSDSSDAIDPIKPPLQTNKPHNCIDSFAAGHVHMHACMAFPTPRFVQFQNITNPMGVPQKGERGQVHGEKGVDIKQCRNKATRRRIYIEMACHVPHATCPNTCVQSSTTKRALQNQTKGTHRNREDGAVVVVAPPDHLDGTLSELDGGTQ